MVQNNLLEYLRTFSLNDARDVVISFGNTIIDNRVHRTRLYFQTKQSQYTDLEGVIAFLVINENPAVVYEPEFDEDKKIFMLGFDDMDDLYGYEGENFHTLVDVQYEQLFHSMFLRESEKVDPINNQYFFTDGYLYHLISMRQDLLPTDRYAENYTITRSDIPKDVDIDMSKEGYNVVYSNLNMERINEIQLYFKNDILQQTVRPSDKLNRGERYVNIRSKTSNITGFDPTIIDKDEMIKLFEEGSYDVISSSIDGMAGHDDNRYLFSRQFKLTVADKMVDGQVKSQLKYFFVRISNDINYEKFYADNKLYYFKRNTVKPRIQIIICDNQRALDLAKKLLMRDWRYPLGFDTLLNSYDSVYTCHEIGDDEEIEQKESIFGDWYAETEGEIDLNVSFLVDFIEKYQGFITEHYYCGKGVYKDHLEYYSTYAVKALEAIISTFKARMTNNINSTKEELREELVDREDD